MELNVYTYFIAGFILDVLLTLYYLAMSEKKVIYSGLMSLIVTFTQIYIFYTIVVSPGIIVHVLSYSIGCGLGTSVTVLWRKNKLKRDIHNGRG